MRRLEALLAINLDALKIANDVLNHGITREMSPQVIGAADRRRGDHIVFGGPLNLRGREDASLHVRFLRHDEGREIQVTRFDQLTAKLKVLAGIRGAILDQNAIGWDALLDGAPRKILRLGRIPEDA